jgi:hypothetical protein
MCAASSPRLQPKSHKGPYRWATHTIGFRLKPSKRRGRGCAAPRRAGVLAKEGQAAGLKDQQAFTRAWTATGGVGNHMASPGVTVLALPRGVSAPVQGEAGSRVHLLPPGKRNV